jgi:hypothetical protein
MHIWPILTSPPLPFFPNFVFSIVTLPSTFAHLSEMVNLVSIPLPGSSRRREQHVHLKPFPSSPNPLIPMVGMQMHGRPWKPTRERTTADRLLSADRGAPAGRAHSSNNRRGSSFEPPPLRAAKGHRRHAAQPAFRRAVPTAVPSLCSGTGWGNADGDARTRQPPTANHLGPGGEMRCTASARAAGRSLG